MWKHFITEYLNFTKRDRIGILVLFSGIVFFLMIPFFYPFFIKQREYDHSTFEKAIAELALKQADSSGLLASQNSDNHSYVKKGKSAETKYYNQPIQGELFYFDPNSTSIADWKRLGVKDKTIATIQNYLAKGGKFYKKEDIGKIYGLHEVDINRLLPYVKLSDPNVKKQVVGNGYNKIEYKREIFSSTVVDINTADTAAFIALPGIGSKLSQRIIHFRDKLGGFYKVDQISETYGLPDSTFQKIRAYLKVGNASIRKIDINFATLDELKVHPYIGITLANSIVQYRTQHGNYETISDIKKIMTVTSDIFNKMAPYLFTK